MIATEPQETQQRGPVDDQADAILANYFSGENKRDSAEDENRLPEQGPTTGEPVDSQQAQPETPEPDKAAPAGDDGEDGDESAQDYTITDLAEHFEVDPGSLYAAKIAMDNGEKIAIGQMKNEWQDAKRAMAKMEAEQQQVRQAYAHLQQQQAELTAKQGLMQLQPDEEEQRLYSDLIAYQRAEQDTAYWDAQAKQDPGATALALNRLQSQRRDTEQKLQAKQAAREAQQQEKQRELLQMSQREIAKRIPEWQKDQAALRQDWGDIQGLWAKFGLDQSAIETLWQSPPAMHLSHTMLKLLRKIGNADPAKKKVVPIRGLKTGKRSGTPPKNPELEALRAKAKKGNRRAQEKLGADLLKDYL